MSKFIRNPETLGGLANLLLGASICSASLATGIVPPGGAAQFSFGIATLLGHFSNRHVKSAEHVLAQFHRKLESDWRAWAAGSGDTTTEELELAIASFNEVLPLIELSPAEIVSKRFDAQAMADLILSKAETAMPDAYRPTQQNSIARRFLHDLTRQAYGYLTAMPDFTAKIAPTLWGDILGQLDRVETAIAQGQSHQEKRFDALEALMQQALAQGATMLARQGGVSDTALIALAKRITADITDTEQALRELEQAVDIAISVQTGAVASSDSALATAAAFSAKGDYDDAARTLDSALADAEATHRDRMLTLLQAGLEQDLLRRETASAASRIIKTADLKSDGRASFAELSAVWMGWFARGRDHGLFLDLDVAADLARQMHTRATDARERGSARNYLGVISHIKGEREGGTEILLAAVTAFEEALTEWTRDLLPNDWAKAKMNLANSLHALAQRDAGNDRLSRAINAYHDALELRTRAEFPSDWALTQMNLGTALRTMGEREQSTTLIAQSIAAFDAALTVRTQTAMPEKWAMTTLNKSISLRVIGEMQQDPAPLEQALTLFGALGETPLPPYAQAVVDFERGVLHVVRARMGGGITDWQLAHTAFDLAIRGFPPEGAPVDRLTATAYDAIVQQSIGLHNGSADDVTLGRDRFALARSQLAAAGHNGRIAALDRIAKSNQSPFDTSDEGQVVAVSNT